MRDKVEKLVEGEMGSHGDKEIGSGGEIHQH